MDSVVISEAGANGQTSAKDSAIITDSILKNKEHTKRYWERRMSADFHDMMVMKNGIDSMDAKKESLIEKEIRIQKEREHALEQERKAALKMAKETKSETFLQLHHKSNGYQKQMSLNDIKSSAPVPATRSTISTASKVSNGVLKSNTLNKRYSSMSNLMFNGSDVSTTNGYKQPTFASGSKQAMGFKTQKGLMQKFLENHSKKSSATPSTTTPPLSPVAPMLPSRPKIDFPPVEPNQSQNHPNWTKRPGYISTEDKIQKELEEMRLRENELKSERAKLLGCSQPNLLSIGLDKESDTDSGNESMGQLRSVSSNPNLLDDKDCDEYDEPKPIQKRKSALFEVWERRVRNQD